MKLKYDRVILADTHHTMLEGIRGLLETMFEAVVMVADDTSLFDAAARLEADLIVADLSLPVTRDVNIVRRLKERFPERKLIVLSVHDESIALEEVMEAGAEGFVLKRTAATDLIPAVRAVLRGRKYASPHLKKEGKHTRWGIELEQGTKQPALVGTITDDPMGMVAVIP